MRVNVAGQPARPAPSPYLLTTVLFAALAGLAALDAALASLGLAPFFVGLRWLRVHLVTLGVLAQVLFGLLPPLVAARVGRPRPAIRWDIWLAVNLGLLVLAIGIPLVQGTLILVGGALVFGATALLLLHLRDLGARAGLASAGRRFYLAGLGYFLVGITIGSGLWLGWAEPLRIANALETHIHANVFGFLGLSFAGLLIDLAAELRGRPVGPRAADWIFWMMAAGTLGLVLGPWLGLHLLTAPGALLHLGASLWLVARVVLPLVRERPALGPGRLHLPLAYAWFLVPIAVAPLVLFGTIGTRAADIEQSAPQGLVYTWGLQLGCALLPLLFRRALLPGESPRLGGGRLTLLAVNLGGLLLWASIFLEASRAPLYAATYACWAAAALALATELGRIARDGLARIEAEASSGIA